MYADTAEGVQERTADGFLLGRQNSTALEFRETGDMCICVSLSPKKYYSHILLLDGLFVVGAPYTACTVCVCSKRRH